MKRDRGVRFGRSCLQRWRRASIGVLLAGWACGDDKSEATGEGALSEGAADAGPPTLDCGTAPPQSLCVPDDGEMLLYGAVPDPDLLDLQLFRSRPQRSDTVQLTPDGLLNPSDFNSYGGRSPDRHSIVFVSGRDKPPSSGSISRGLVYVAGADGSDERRLTNASAVDCDESMPRYSPDGQWISFWRSCADDPVAESSDFMFRIRPDGTDEERLVDRARVGADSALLWGTFARDNATLYALEDASVGPAAAVSNTLVAYDLASRTLREVYDFLPEGGYIWGHPLELADGDLLYLYRNETATPTVARLEKIHPGGTGRIPVREIRILADGAVEDIRFMINPAGDQLAYVHTENSRTTSLWVSGIEGEGARQVAPVAGTQFWLTWNW